MDALTYVKSMDRSRENYKRLLYGYRQKNDPYNIFQNKNVNGNIQIDAFNAMMAMQLRDMHSNIKPEYLYGPGILGSAKGNKIVDFAAAEIGIGSDANSAERYGEAGPWCAAFATEMYKRATGKSDTPIGDSHYVPTLVDNAKTKGLFANANDPQGAQPGNFVFFGDDYHHIGIVERVDPDGTVHTIEGNTANMVARRTYSPDSGKISGYAKVVAA